MFLFYFFLDFFVILYYYDSTLEREEIKIMKDDHHTIDLFEAIAMLETVDDVKNFLIDLCTPAEIKAFTERWKVCQLLDRKEYSYRQIREMTKASLTTIGRVSRFLNDENYGGYRKVLKKISLSKNE